MSETPEHRPRRRWLSALKVVLALAIVALIARNVPWGDELRYKTADAERSYAGRIEGDWKAERVQFVFDEPQVRATLPGAWSADGEAPRVASVEIARSAETSWQPGLPRVFLEVDPRGLWIALGLAALGILATSLRWWRLLCAAGCPTGFFEAFRLTYIGFFFNIVVPGLTGGDVVKAVMVARRHPERKAAAAISVLVDRLIGVFVLALLGALTILVQGERFAAVRAPVLVGLGLAVLGVLGYTNATLRRVVGFEHWIAKLPMAGMFRQVDEAATIYSRRPFEFALALLFSLFNQACVIGALWVLGASFGERALGLVNYVVVASIGNIAAAVPLTPGGVGVTEVVYGQLFEMQGGALLFGIATSLAWRVCMISVGLLGGLFLLLPGGRIADETPPSRSKNTPDVG